MTPIDFRNATWTELTARLRAKRLEAYHAWAHFGPGTTREVCAAAGLSLLKFRPRTTELVQLGAVCLAEKQATTAEGSYRARDVDEWYAWVAQQRVFTTAQLQML